MGDAEAGQSVRTGGTSAFLSGNEPGKYELVVNYFASLIFVFRFRTCVSSTWEMTQQEDKL